MKWYYVLMLDVGQPSSKTGKSRKDTKDKEANVI